ncbi:MAG: 3-phosphoglycerate dehydrogenase, partial [Myxococcota bacterium]
MVRLLMHPLQRALSIEGPDPKLDEHLRTAGIQPFRLENVPDQETLIREMREKQIHVLCKRSRVPITREVVASCPDLHAIQLCCIGDDSIDKQACADHGVMVFHDPVSNGRSVVELAVA